MKDIKIFNKIEVYLEGFGFIEITEAQIEGNWHMDLFPRGTENDEKKLLVCLDKAHGDKTFSFVSHLRELNN
jgi:hypothetical protein